MTEIVPPPNYLPTTEVQQIKLELDEDGNPIPAGPLVFTNQAKVGLRVLKYDRLSHKPMSGVTFEIFHDGASIGRYETNGSGEIVLTNIEPGTYRAVEVDTGDADHILDSSYQEVELVAGGGTKELIFFNDNKPGMKLVKVDSSDPSKTISGAKFRIEAVDGSYGPQEFTTNGSGEIDLSMLPTGAYVVTEIECAGYVIDDAQRIIHLKANDRAEFVFTNTKKPSFRLVKTSADGTLLDGVTFRISPIGDASRSIDRTTANGGEILVEGLEPGIYSVVETATLPNHILDTTEYHVELSPGKTSELRLSNDKKPVLTLSKIDADSGDPIPNTVFTVKALDGTYQDDWRTGPDGKVSQILDPGVYEVTEKSVPAPYYLPDKDADRTQTITLSPNDEKTLTFRNRKAPELTIFKENSITGEAIEHAKFHITYTSNGEAAEAPATIDYGEVFTDSRGEIKIHELGKRLYPGEFTITEVEPADGFQLKEPLTQTVIIHGNESKRVVFQNTPLSALVVWKYDSVTGAPVEGAIFQVRYMSGTSGSGGTVIGTYKTGPGGSFTINRLKAGAYTVEELASDGDHVMDTAPQTAYISGEEQAVVQLYFGNSPKGAVLIKKIDSVTHEPLSDCEFFITDSHGTMLGDANGKFVTDSAGTILISGIDPGTTIVARETRAKANYILDDVPQTATIKAGQTVTLEFRNQPKGSVTLYKYSGADRKTPLEGVGFKVTFADGKVVDNIGGKLSSNGIYYTDSEGQINISGVTGTLIFTEISTIPGYLIDENRKSQTIVVNPDDHQSVYFYNDPVGSILVKKMSSTTKEPLSDVVIRITRTDGSVVGTSNGEFRTDENGFIKVDVEPGSYIVQEVSAKPGYLLDDTPKVVEVKGSGIYNVELFNQPLGSLIIHKYSSLDRKTPLAGVQFKVTYAPGCVVDDENGTVSSNGIYYTGSDGTITINGIVGTVTITEQAAIPGYTIDPETRSQTIVVNPDDVQHAYFYNSPKNTLIVEKYLETESGNEPLKGVTFQVTDSSGAVIGNSNGEFITGDDGRVVIAGVEPGTTINVREIKVPEGVVLDSIPKSIKISEDGANILRFYNKKTGYLVVRKLDSVTKQPLAGVEFELTYADGSYVDDDFGHLSSKGRFKTNDAGEIRVPVVGTVVVKEISTLPTHVIDQATQIQTVTVNPADTQTLVVYNEPLCSLTLRKLDAVTGKPVPNTEFTLKDGDGNILGRYTTGADGTVTVTGLIPNSTVVVVESKVPSNYVLDSTPRTIIVRNGSNSIASGGGAVNGGTTGGGNGGNDLTVENLPKTTLTIEKYLETETGEQPLKGVTFLVTDSSGAVIGPNNGEYISDENGRIVIPNLEPGITITAKEIRVPDGVVLDPTPKSIKIEGGIGGQTLRFVNQKAGNLIINKVDGIDKHPLSGVRFKITYADGSNVDQNGGKTSTNGIYTTDTNGQIKISGIVGTVIITEIETIPGYYIEEKYRTQTVQVNANDTQTVTVYNVPTQALVIQKFVTGSKDQPLAGVEFLITDSSGAFVGPNNGIYKTDQFGRITIKDLTPGTVITARETKSLDGYVLDSTPQSIEIKSGEVQTLTFYNAPIGGLELIKVNEADKTQRIKGVTFEIRKMDGALVDTVTTGDNGRVHVSLDAGDYYCVEIEAAEGLKIDTTPHYFTIQDNKTTTLTVTNAPFSGIILHKIDSVTGLGIYNVKFLVYDQNKNPLGEYSTDDQGYIYIDDLTVQGKGKLFIRELEAAPGYELDKEYKTVYVQPGKTIEIEWQNTPITGQFQIYKYAAEYNEVTGTPAGAPLQGAVYEISEARSGRVVDYITTDARGVAASKPLPLGRYKIVEVTAPTYWQLSGKTFDETLEYSGQIIKVSDYDKPSNLGVTITKRGNAEALAGSQMRYDFTVANTSNVPLDNYYWHDRIPTDAARATVFTTGTYNARLNYRILYKTNYSATYQVLASNLITSSNYSFSLNAIPMQAGEYVTDIYCDFGKVPVGFQSVANPTLTVTVSGTAANGYQLINRADAGGKYQGTWQTAQATWVTVIRKLTNTIIPTLPKTGY
ncbi:SpaA isopeptide-forming pilin-related protein [Oscillospiraceae bacterium 44-5]